AWHITHGDSTLAIGIADSHIESHFDLNGKIDTVIQVGNDIYDRPHGTGVAAIIAAKTDNGIGMASIGYNTHLVAADSPDLLEQLDALINYPGMRVVNCSWGYKNPPNYLEEVIQDAINNDVLIVAAAGN